MILTFLQERHIESELKKLKEGTLAVDKYVSLSSKMISLDDLEDLDENFNENEEE